MKRKLLIVGIALLVIINLSAFATLTYNRYCQKHETCPHKKEHVRGEFLCQELSLTKSQIEEMRALKRSFHSQADSISFVLFKKRTVLVDLLSTQNPDTVKINIALKEMDALQAELQKHVICYLLKEKEMLNPEQRQKFFSIIKERLMRESKHFRANGFNFIEDSCNAKCQKLTNCPINNQINERK